MLTLFTERMVCCDWSRHRGGRQIKLHKARRRKERKPPDRGPGVQRAVKAATALREVMPNGGSRGGNYSLEGGSAIEHQQGVLVGIARNGRVLHNILYA